MIIAAKFHRLYYSIPHSLTFLSISVEKCPNGQFDCGETCISEDRLCDGVDDCENGADELGCKGKQNNLALGFYSLSLINSPNHGIGCDEDEFECNDGSCIELDRKCDGQVDCSENEDEDNCDAPGGKLSTQITTLYILYPSENSDCRLLNLFSTFVFNAARNKNAGFWD